MRKELETYLSEKVIKSDIPESCEDIVEAIGIYPFMKLCDTCSGNEIYVPKKEKILCKARNREIKKEYNGYNLKELSQKYDLTITHIRNITKE